MLRCFLKIVFSIVEVAMAIQGQLGECVDYMEVEILTVKPHCKNRRRISSLACGELGNFHSVLKKQIRS